MLNSISIYSDIVSQLRTKAQMDELSSAIDTMQSLLFQVDVPIEAILENVGQGQVKEALQRALLASDPSLGNREITKEFLARLKEAMSQVRILDLTLAFEPKEKTIETLFAWVGTNLGDGIVLHVSVDKEILGGAIITWNGVYKDLSLKSRLENVFKEQKPQIVSFVK